MTESSRPPPPTRSLAGSAAALAKLWRPYLYISSYYVVLAAALMALVWLDPRIAELLPIGGANDLGAAGRNALENPVVEILPSTGAESVRLALAIIASFMLMLPVTWICMGARQRKDVAQSFIQTILVLPIVITGIVHVVHNSLALAFSLAGIVAGVRFRHTLKDSAETTYLFTSIAVGVACGVNAIEVAAIISIFFNYAVLGLWATGYGAQFSGKQMFSREWMGRDEAQIDEGRHAEEEDHDD